MNRTQYNRCVESNLDSLYRFIVGLVRSQADAEDIIQESFARLWEHRTKVEAIKSKSFLFTIAYRLAISHLRNRKTVDIFSQTTFCHSTNEKQYDNMTELLWQALERLNSIQRTVIMLCDWEGYSYNEIADITQLSQAQVKITIFRARTAIKQQLENEYRQ